MLQALKGNVHVCRLDSIVVLQRTREADQLVDMPLLELAVSHGGQDINELCGRS